MTDLVVSPGGLTTGAARRLTWLVAGALLYPLALDRFFAALAAGGSLGATGAAVLALATALAIPILGLVTILRRERGASAGAVRVRRLAHVSVAVPPLYTATGVVLLTLGLPGWDVGVWSVAWLSTLAVVLLWPAGDAPRAEVATPAAWLRWAHGLAAATVLVGFIALHLGNHLLALGGTDLHARVQDGLRLWYRAAAVEPVLIGLMVWLIGSGMALARHRTLRFSGRWDAVQTASGAYLGAFLVSHMTAALIMARATFGIDTTWQWAAGAPGGLLGDPWSVRLLPHYLLAVAAVAAHAGCGLRSVLLAHGARRRVADGAAATMIGGGGVLALVLVAALLGARI